MIDVFSQPDLKSIAIRRLPIILKNILILWKDAPSQDSWAMEKLMELFQKDLAADLEIVTKIDFKSFLSSFFDQGILINYPDFVMNNVSMMAAEVLLSVPDELNHLEDEAFRIIRIPLQYWLVNKGHRVNIAFTLYRKFIQKNLRLHLLEAVNFDVDQAFAYAIASSFNYTRQTAANYFVDLICLVYRQSTDTLLSANASGRLREAVAQLIETFPETILQKQDNSIDAYIDVFSIAANFCQLMARCAQTCPGWCYSFASISLFESVVKLVQAIPPEVIIDTKDLCTDVIYLFLRFRNCSDDNIGENQKQMLKVWLHHLCMIDNQSVCSDIIHASTEILLQFKCQGDESLFLELSILPLLCMLDITAEKVVHFCGSFVVKVQKYLHAEQKSKPSSLFKNSIRNLHLITANIKDFQHISMEVYNSIFSYLTLRSLHCPSGAQSMLCGHSVRNAVIASFLANQSKHCCQHTEDDLSILINIQVYTKAAINFFSILFWQLEAVFESYIRALSTLSKRSKKDINIDIIKDVANYLQLKMVSVEPNVRELAVKTCGDLYFIIRSCQIECGEMNQSLISMWKCLDDKSERVAWNVLENLWQMLTANLLQDFLSIIDSPESELVIIIQKKLTDRENETLKPTSYKILTSLCCDTSVLVRYAEVCLQQSYYLLSLSVQEHIQSVFSSCLNKPVDTAVDSVMDLISQGWVDLVLGKVSGQDVCSSRVATSTLEALIHFMNRPEVIQTVSDCARDISRCDTSSSVDCSELNKILQKVCDKLECFYQLDLTGGSNEQPVIKKVKRDDLGAEWKFLLGFINNTACDNIGNIDVKPKDEEMYLDSTKDLPTLEISSKLLPSQKCVQAMLYQSYGNMTAIKLTYWAVFKTLLQKLNLSLLKQEAMKSTDEYIRNSVAVLDDVEVVLERRLKSSHLQLENEITKILTKQLSSLLAEAFKDNACQDQIFQGILKVLRHLEISSTQKKEACTFYLREKKDYIQLPAVSDQFVLSTFIERLKISKLIKPSCVDYSIQTLMDTFLSSAVACDESEIQSAGDELNTETFFQVQDANGDAVLKNNSFQVTIKDDSINGQMLTQANHTDYQQGLILLDVHLVKVTQEELKEILEKITQSDNQSQFEQLLKCLTSFAQYLLAAISSTDNEDTKRKKLCFLSTCLAQFDEYMASDLYDKGDDPCALDCF